MCGNRNTTGVSRAVAMPGAAVFIYDHVSFKFFGRLPIGYNIDNDIFVKGNPMAAPLLTLHFCPTHNLLFFPLPAGMALVHSSAD
jgi:hypothetical protein